LRSASSANPGTKVAIAPSLRKPADDKVYGAALRADANRRKLRVRRQLLERAAAEDGESQRTIGLDEARCPIILQVLAAQLGRLSSVPRRAGTATDGIAMHRMTKGGTRRLTWIAGVWSTGEGSQI
jgi:hypothetical protein